MKSLQTLDRAGFLEVLSSLPPSSWSAGINDRCIHLRRTGSSMIFSPLTAVFFELTGVELHRGSFIHAEITHRFKLSGFDILDIVYAEICCSCGGKHYCPRLRVAMLRAIRPLFGPNEIDSYFTEIKREPPEMLVTLL